MLNFFSNNKVSKNEINTGVLGTLSKYSWQIAGVLGITVGVGVVSHNYNSDKSDVNQVALSSNTGDIVVGNKKGQELSNNRDNDEGFVMAKVTKKGIGVLEFMNENGFDGDWKNLVNRRTGKRVIDPRRDLIFGETYILAENDKYAERLAFLITHKNKRVVYADKGLNNLSEGSKTPLVAKIEQKTSKEQNSPSVVANGNSLSGQKIQKPASEKGKELTRFSYKDYIEGKLKEAVVPELGTKIELAFKKGGEKVSSYDMLKMITSVKTSNGKFLASYYKAVNAGDSKKRALYIEKALREVVALDNDAGIFQITPGWIKTEMKFGGNVRGQIIDDLATLKSKVRSVLVNASIKGLSPDELFLKLSEVDARFNLLQMGRVVQQSFLRIYDNLGKYNLDGKTRLKLALGAYNRGEGWAYKSARTKKVEISNDLNKRLKHIKAMTDENTPEVASNDQSFDNVSLDIAKQNPIVVAQASLEVRNEIADVISRDSGISNSIKASVTRLLLTDESLEKVRKNIEYYEKRTKIGSEEQKQKARLMLAKLNVFMEKYNIKNDEAIIRAENEGSSQTRKVA